MTEIPNNNSLKVVQNEQIISFSWFVYQIYVSWLYMRVDEQIPEKMTPSEWVNQSVYFTLVNHKVGLL